jgi:putative lipoprotein
VSAFPRICRAWSLLLAPCSLLFLAPCPAAADPDPWWGQDKAVHFSACFMAAGDGYATAAVLSKQGSHRLLAGFGFAVAAGAGKELVDLTGGGDASLRDLTWDVVGGATGAAISWLIDRYLF